MTEGKGRLGEFERMQNERVQYDKTDRLSDLPDVILLYIMMFMNTKHAVQTCILSKRWRELWKTLTNLTLYSYEFNNLTNFGKFVFLVISHRDDAVSLHDFVLCWEDCFAPELLDRVMKYAGSHNLSKCTIEVYLKSNHEFKLHTCIFSCQTLTYLKLSISANPSMIELPTSLQLPALKSLHLEEITFTAYDNGVVDPFSNCHMLNTLVLLYCNLHRDVKELTISNSMISSLTIGNTILEAPYKVVLSTPNLRSLTIMSDLIHEVSACDLPSIEQVNFDIKAYLYTNYEKKYATIFSLLQVIANNVRIMTLSSGTLMILIKVLLTNSSMISQFPCFVKLKSLKLKMKSSSNVSIEDEELSKITKILLQKSPQATVDMIDF